MARPSRDADILAAALAAFAEQGYDATRVRDIARRAGVSDAALYCHHKSKESVALALFQLHMRRYSEALQAAVCDPAVSVRERIHAAAQRSLRMFAEEPHAFAFVITHQARFVPTLASDFPLPIPVVEALVREGQSDGSVRRGPVRLLTALVLGCILQPVRTVLEAPAGTISVHTPAARAIVAEAAWRTIANKHEQFEDGADR